MEPQSQPSQGIHPGDATTASNGGTNMISSGRNEDGGSPPQQQQQSATLTTINSADFFALDGMQYNVPRGYEDSSEDAYNVQQFYQDAGVFSCDDLYAVMDPSNPSGGITEIDGSAANWQSTGFIPLGTSDMKQLGEVASNSTGGGDEGGSTSAAPASGPYYRLITLTNEGAQVQAYTPDSNNDSLSSASSSEMTGGGIGNGGDSSAEYMASPAAGVGASSQDGLAPPAKVRKPRGRKPKHVKEAEAAAAAAAQVASLPLGESTPSPVQLQGDATGASSPARRGSLEDIQRPSTSVIAHQPQQPVPPLSPFPNPQQQQVISGPIASPSGNNPAPVSRYPQHGQQQLSLERLAYQDRQAILMARRNQENLLRQQAHTQVQHLSSPHRPPPSILLHHRPTMPLSSSHQHRIPAQPTFANSNANTQQGRLEQFFSSRIAAPSNKSTVKPKIIQENRGIYNLLTAPTVPCNPPPPASFEKRWMQYPNPSILENENNPRQPSNAQPSSSVSPKAVGEGVPTAEQASRRITCPPPQPSSPYGAPSPRKLMDQSSSLFYIGGVGAGTVPSHQQARVNIRRGVDAGGTEPLAFHSHPPQHRPHPHDAGLGYYASQQLYRSAGGGSASSSAGAYHQHHHNPAGYSTNPEIEKLKSRIDDMTQIQYDLKYRVNQLMRLNKNLMMKIREVVEEHEDFRAYLRENRDYNSGESDYLGGGVRGGSGRCMMDCGGWSEEALDAVMDYPWLLRRRVSVPRSMHRYPQDTGDRGKRSLDRLSVGEEHGNSRKRVCSEEGGVEREGDGKEVDKTLLLKANDERTGNLLGTGDIGGSQNNSVESRVVDLTGCGVSEEEAHMQKLKLKLESSPPARGETVSPKSIKSVVTEFATPTSEDGDNTMSTIFNSPLTVGARAPAAASALLATAGKGKSCFQACDFATFKNFSNGCGVVGADAETGEEDNVMLISKKVEEKHNDKSKEAGEDDLDKSTNDKMEENAFILDLNSEIA